MLPIIGCASFISCLETHEGLQGENLSETGEFDTDDVTFVEFDIQLPNYSGNKELELAGLQDISDDDKRVVDAHADHDDEVDWEQLLLTHVDNCVSPVDTTPRPTTSLPDPASDSSAAQAVGGKPGAPPDDAEMTDSESIFQLCAYSPHSVSGIDARSEHCWPPTEIFLRSAAPCVGAGSDGQSLRGVGSPVGTMADTGVSSRTSAGALISMMLNCNISLACYTHAPTCVNDTIDLALHSVFHQTCLLCGCDAFGTGDATDCCHG